jgi:hypothetical protein
VDPDAGDTSGTDTDEYAMRLIAHRCPEIAISGCPPAYSLRVLDNIDGLQALERPWGPKRGRGAVSRPTGTRTADRR